METIKPCPFCGTHLVMNEGLSNRSAKLYLHPKVEPRCIGQNLGIWDQEADRIAAWNRRAPSTDPRPAAQPGVVKGAPVTITYTNWRGETDRRTILPVRMWFGSTEWHPNPQWLITARDVDKDVERDFALLGISAVAAPVSQEPVAWQAEYRQPGQDRWITRYVDDEEPSEAEVERAAKAAYEKFIEDVRDLEPSWEALPEFHRYRMIESQRAALLAAKSKGGQADG